MLMQAFSSLPQGVRLRAMVPDDQSFLSALYADTRADEVNQVDWPQVQKAAFLEQQFQAQHQHYQQHFAEAEFLLIEQHAIQTDQQGRWQPIGRLYLDQRNDEIRLIDIALMADHRNRGLGTNILRQLLGIAADRSLAVRIHVEQFNPAADWYRRHGFELLEQRGIYWFMQWSPADRSCAEV